MKNSLLFTLFLFVLTSFVNAEVSKDQKKEQVLDFSAGVIEGELTPPSILMELGTNFKDFDDLIVLREDFNEFHRVDSSVRLRYIEENQ
jgi:hypothetical protein